MYHHHSTCNFRSFLTTFLRQYKHYQKIKLCFFFGNLKKPLLSSRIEPKTTFPNHHDVQSERSGSRTCLPNIFPIDRTGNFPSRTKLKRLRFYSIISILHPTLPFFWFVFFSKFQSPTRMVFFLVFNKYPLGVRWLGSIPPGGSHHYSVAGVDWRRRRRRRRRPRSPRPDDRV